MELAKLEAAGCRIEVGSDSLTVEGPDRPDPVDFATLPYPGFHTDMHPQMVALLSIADGTSIMTENVYSSRFRYIGELNRLGADIHADGQHVVIRGVDTLSGARSTAVTSEPRRPSSSPARAPTERPSSPMLSIWIGATTGSFRSWLPLGARIERL